MRPRVGERSENAMAMGLAGRERGRESGGDISKLRERVRERNTRGKNGSTTEANSIPNITSLILNWRLKKWRWIAG